MVKKETFLRKRKGTVSTFKTDLGERESGEGIYKQSCIGYCVSDFQ